VKIISSLFLPAPKAGFFSINFLKIDFFHKYLSIQRSSTLKSFFRQSCCRNFYDLKLCQFALERQNNVLQINILLSKAKLQTQLAAYQPISQFSVIIENSERRKS